ncbi:transposase [Corallococcus sicarius]|uniref:transposase n=1 Tax=Corallococcus sicarius TaxID=2316726 RepID=UPI001315592A|nr:transposase [Corallococcus sicarius]
MKKQQKQGRTAERGRFSAKRKKEAVLRLLKGEELDALSRELGVTAAVLSEWREKFLAGAVMGRPVGSLVGHLLGSLPRTVRPARVLGSVKGRLRRNLNGSAPLTLPPRAGEGQPAASGQS